ncbi:MAG: cob(I)yrinic acid a,c-diamide adenosyltransferase [Bacteroidales bacterium]|nr:cob(I)yrinic acid a,c-diamide adenosyltransferase [Bacteroidales bacterium]
MKIYTKTGDAGITSLASGERVPKTCCRLQAYGTIDELNSYIGLLLTYQTGTQHEAALLWIQSTLFTVGGYLATDSRHEPRCVVAQDDIDRIEQQIDLLDSELPPLRAFILPGGCRPAAIAHICRTVCRRAERCILALAEEGVEIDTCLLSYVNRLSDYFFVLARKINKEEKQSENIWKIQK